LTGNASDYFETGSNGGGVASGTNRITTYSVGTFWMYDQTNSGAPTLDPVTSYNFSASVILASNLAATGASLAPPGGVTQPMSRNIVSPEQFYLYGYSSNLTIFQANYPNGSYGFTVQAANSNQQVSVNLPAGLAQPNAPHVSNFSSVQTVDPTQPFTLLWDAFPPAGATNIIVVMLTDTQGATVALSNGLPGSATSIAIPVGVLQPSAAYSGSIDFESYLGNTNASYGTAAFRATTTRFTLATSSGAVTAPLVLTNTVRSAGAFGFQILSSPGQTLTVEYATNLKSGVWNTLLVTNSPGRVQISDPVSAANAPRFYRARKGG